MHNILLCDDERDIVNALKIYLSNPNYRFFEAGNGKEAIEIIQNNEIHLVLLDIMMPVMDGVTALSQMREITNAPVILLTAKSEDTDEVLGLNLGADDYITKPFHPLEVAARVNSQLRRYTRLGANTPKSDCYLIGGIELNDKNKRVTVDGEEVSLTPKEYEILKLFLANPDRVFSPREVYAKVWKESPLSGNENTVAVHIRHLREKMSGPTGKCDFIKTVWGVGYKVED